MATYKFQLNGRPATVDSWDPAQPLLYLLRNALGLHGPKFGCGLSQCGVHCAGGWKSSTLLRHPGAASDGQVGDHAGRARHAGEA